MVFLDKLELRFTFSKRIGSGAFGTIVEGRDLNGLPVVRKSISNQESAIQEISIYSMIDHPNIAKLLAWSYSKDSWFLVFPRGIPIEEALTKRLIDVETCISQLLHTVNFLHSHGIYHGDLKLPNIVYTDRLTLIDFGSARLATQYGNEYLVRGLSPTPGYIDPEYVQGDWNTIRSELYSLAGIIHNFRMITTQGIISPLHYGIYPFDKSDGLVSALSHFPIVERKNLSEIIQDFSIPSPGYTGRLCQKATPEFAGCQDDYRKIIRELYIIFGRRTDEDTIPTWQMFLGLGLFRKVLPVIIPNYSNKNREAVVLAIACIYLISLVTHVDIFIPRPWNRYTSFIEELVPIIMKLTDGMLITETDWDRADSYEDLVYYTKGLSECELQPDHRQLGYPKTVYFYKVLEATIRVVSPTASDLSIMTLSKSDVLREMPSQLKILKEKPDFLSHQQHMACYYFLHYRKFLSETNIELAQDIYNTLVNHPLGVQVLDLIVKYPHIEFKSERLHPFQMSYEDYLNSQKIDEMLASLANISSIV